MARKNEPYIYKVLRRETPNPRQQAFFRAEAANIAYGGARGGGKSWAMRRKLVLLAMRYPGLKLLLLRRTLPELRANHILPLQRELAGYAAWSGAERAFRFPNGSRLVMAGVTYLIRAVPFTLCRKKVENRFVKSFLAYVPYAVLGAMTFPAIIYSADKIAAGVAGTVVALIMAYRRRSLLTVALAACAAAFLVLLIV